MQTKNALTVLGTIIFLIGVFGYIFPEWHYTRFSNNENLFHVLIAVFLWMAASLEARKRMFVLALGGLVFLAWGIWGFTLKDPAVFTNNRLFFKLDEVDNYLHCILALAFAWVWLKNRRTV